MQEVICPNWKKCDGIGRKSCPHVQPHLENDTCDYRCSKSGDKYLAKCRPINKEELEYFGPIPDGFYSDQSPVLDAPSFKAVVADSETGGAGASDKEGE